MFYALLSIILLNIIYVIGFLFTSVILNTTEAHYFLGFDPKLFTFQVRGTRFTIGLYIPIVGLSRIYKIENGEKQRARLPWEFFDQSIFRRFVVTLSGAVALLVASVIGFIGVNYFVQESIITKEEVNRLGIDPSDQAKTLGFQRGDKIIAINGKDYEQFSDLVYAGVIARDDTYYTVLRNEKELTIKVEAIDVGISGRNKPFLSLLAPFEVSAVMPGSPADNAGIISGDIIVKVNGQSIISNLDMNDAFIRDDDSYVDLEVKRKENDTINTLQLSLMLNAENKIGVSLNELIKYTSKQNTVGEAVHKGTQQAFSTLLNNVDAFVAVFEGRLAPRKKVNGPIGIASGAGFWRLTAFYAIWYALWNFLPFPKAAFWELIALVYEGIGKRKYPYKAFTMSIKMAWIPLIGFILWIIVNDMAKLF